MITKQTIEGGQLGNITRNNAFIPNRKFGTPCYLQCSIDNPNNVRQTCSSKNKITSYHLQALSHKTALVTNACVLRIQRC